MPESAKSRPDLKVSNRRREETLALEQIARLTAELERIQQSTGWILVQKARAIRSRLFREGTVRGYLWKSGMKAVKWVIHKGRVRPSVRATDRRIETGITKSDASSARRTDTMPTPTVCRFLDPPSLRVSVLVPNYNHEPYLEERLSSIFRQTLQPHEIIFLDDASSDGSVNVARRMAAQSPVPFQMVLNEENSGSTFRQWMKGFALATGDLIWIAESDDRCDPHFLEELVPAFCDLDVSLAYSQSAVIGSVGERYADNYLFNTDDISFLHWRSAYVIDGTEEVELALSQKNTIPNASAVLFRRPNNLNYADKLITLRLAGDWLFYAMQIRRGKIAFVPRSLNDHRHHAKTVRNAFEQTSRLFDEQLQVKAQIFESFPVSSDAISRSIACSIREYNDRAKHLALAGPSLLDNPAFAPQLARIDRALQASLAAPERLRVLIVVDAVQSQPRQVAAIRLANALAERYQVYLCNTRQWMVCPRAAAQVDQRVVLLEGTLAVTPWAFGGDSDRERTSFGAVPSGRAEVLEELIRFHEIDVIHSHGWWADRLVFTVNRSNRVAWFIDMRSDTPGYREDTGDDPDYERLIGPMLSSAKGVFYAQPADLSRLNDSLRCRTLACVQVFDGVNRNTIRGGADSVVPREDDDFLCVLGPTSEHLHSTAEAEAIRAVLQVNALPSSDRGHRLVRLIIPAADRKSYRQNNQSINRDIVLHDFDAEFCDVATQCDAGLFSSGSITRAGDASLIECLACGVPVLAYDGAVSPGLLLAEAYEAGVVVPVTGEGTTTSESLADAILGYLRDPGLHATHRMGARAVFEKRFRLDQMAAKVGAAYEKGLAAINLASDARRIA